MEIRRDSGDAKGTEFFIGREETPLSGTFGAESKAVYLLVKLPGKIVAESCCRYGVFMICGRKAGALEGNPHADMGWRRKWISLHMIYG